MRPQVQRDDCLAACFASLLGVGLDDLPDIAPDSPGRQERWGEWLLEEHGQELVVLEVPPLAPGRVPVGYWIGVYGDRRANKAAAAGLLDDEHRLPTHTVIHWGPETIAWNPWGADIPADDLGELLAGIELVPLEPHL